MARSSGRKARLCITAWPATLTGAGEGHLGFGRFGSGEVKRFAACSTVEVDMIRRAVIQARGWRNRAPSGKPFRLLQDWAVRERIRLAI